MERRLIDVREYPEFAGGHIENACLVPLGSLASASGAWDKRESLTLVCKSGRRAEQAHKLLEDTGFTDLSILPGGMDAWIAAGKPTRTSARQPWAMERQVRIVAGSLVVLTLALSWVISSYFLIGTALVGAGLVFAGVSNTCMMASALALLPWNRPIEVREPVIVSPMSVTVISKELATVETCTRTLVCKRGSFRMPSTHRHKRWNRHAQVSA